MRCGHLYLRIDDFGAQVSHGTLECSRSEGCMRRLRKAPSRDEVPLELATLRQRVELEGSSAGELLFTRQVAHVRALRAEDFLADQRRPGRLSLVRARSEPPPAERHTADATCDDWCWVNEAIHSVTHTLLPMPPSLLALRLLLEHFDPVGTRLFGTAGFKHMEELYEELTSRSTFLIRAPGSVHRCCETSVLQLQWQGHVLVNTHEVPPGRDCPVVKNSFIATRLMPRESWQTALMRFVTTQLGLPACEFRSSLQSADDASCHEVIEERTVSPSYPGLQTLYRTHMVRWTVRDEYLHLYAEHGLPVGAALSRGSHMLPVDHPWDLGSHFVTTRDSPKGPKTLFWRWLPVTRAQQLQRFLNMGEATADARWAKYAFQTEGVVQFPPTEDALRILLHRCGIDTALYGAGQGKTLHSFWLELVNQECYLQMHDSCPFRVAEATFVWVRSRSPGTPGGKTEETLPQHHVLVQMQERTADGEVAEVRKLPSTQKHRHETWEAAALRCLSEGLGLAKQHLKGLLMDRASDSSGYSFYEERLEAPAYPGIRCVYRTHLVTFTLRDECRQRLLTLADATEEAVCSRASGISSCSLPKRWRRKPDEGDGSDILSSLGAAGPGSPKAASQTRPPPMERLEFNWVEEDAVQDIRGADLWERARSAQRRQRVSSVLLGLEGSAPNTRSPFGLEHDASGKSKQISALGNRKWRAYRCNGALQIPEDYGGLRMTVTRRAFQELIDTCEDLGVREASQDLLASPTETQSREKLDHSFAERELFKGILAGNTHQAREAIAWFLEYRGLSTTEHERFLANRRRSRR